MMGVIIVIIILLLLMILVLKMTKRYTHNMILMSWYKGQLHGGKRVKKFGPERKHFFCRRCSLTLTHSSSPDCDWTAPFHPISSRVISFCVISVLQYTTFCDLSSRKSSSLNLGDLDNTFSAWHPENYVDNGHGFICIPQRKKCW